MALIGALLFLVVILSDQKNGFNPELSLWKKILGWILLVVGILNVFFIFAKSGLNVSSSYNNQGISFCAVFIGWGIYTLRSTKIHSPLWKRIYKSIVYGLMTFFTFGCGNYHFDTAVPSLIIEIILTIATLVIQLLDVKIYNYRIKKNLKEEERNVPPLPSYMQVSDIALSTPENDTFKIIKNQEKADNLNNIDPKNMISLEHEENKENHLKQECAKKNTEFCRYCGKEIEADSKFCKYCGKDLQHSTYSNNLEGKVRQTYLLFQSVKNKFKIPKIQKPVIKKDKVKKIFKLASFCFLGIIVLGGIAIGVGYYFEEIRPKQKGEEILQSEKNELLSLQNNELYYKCKDIIANNNIPQTKKWDVDYNNRIELTRLAWEKIEQLALEGNDNAQFFLAVKYGGYDYYKKDWDLSILYGEYNNKNLDFDKAAYWYLQAALQGNSDAQNNLGNCYKEGQGVEKDMRKAIYWFRKSAEADNDYGQLNLGDCFRDGYKIKRGEHWEKDKNSYYYDWQYKLGYHTVNDYETLIVQNLDSAFYYWRKSAGQGNQQAKERLQKIY